MEEIVFPNQIRMFRRAKGISMKKLADCLNMSLSAVSKIEKGYRRVNDKQMNKISEFLSCPKSAILITRNSSQPEVIKAWEREQERRLKINQGSGLKTLGAGLRYLRGQKALTLLDISKKAKLTLSVYHRIEMGQREVDEKTFSRIAHALGFSDADLQLEIYRLDMAGALEDLKNSEGKKSGLYVSKGGYNDLPLGRYMIRSDVQDVVVPIYGLPQTDKTIKLDKDNPTSSLVCPSTLDFDKDLYAVPLMSDALGEKIPMRSLLVISPATKPAVGDLAAYPIQENLIKIVSLDKDGDGNYLLRSPQEKDIAISKETTETLQKVIMIMLA